MVGIMNLTTPQGLQQAGQRVGRAIAMACNTEIDAGALSHGEALVASIAATYQMSKRGGYTRQQYIELVQRFTAELDKQGLIATPLGGG